jgi:hypothetical protein
MIITLKRGDFTYLHERRSFICQEVVDGLLGATGPLELKLEFSASPMENSYEIVFKEGSTLVFFNNAIFNTYDVFIRFLEDNFKPGPVYVRRVL